MIVHVINATMPTSYAFRSWRDEDINSIPEDQKSVKDNTTHVKTTSSLFTSDTDVTTDITFKGNVNTMTASEDGGKYYRVRIKVEGINVEDVIAVNKDDVTKRYEVTAIDKNSNEVYVKLNANDSVVNLVLANKNASKEQIEKETASCYKVTFESTSKIWLRDARVAKNITSEINGDKVTKAIINKQNNQTIDVGVKFNELAALKLKKNADGSVTANEETGGDKWIPFVVKVSNDVANKENSVRNAVYVDNENVMINKTINGENGENEVVLWVKGNLEEKIDFTLHYVKGSEKEDLPITVILHDATTPIIQSVTTGSDVNSKGVIISGIESSVHDVSDREHDKAKIVAGYNVNVDTYKYAMDTITMKGEKGSAVEGRWYSVVLKTNVPVSSLVYNDGTDEEPNWKPFPVTEGNTITIWINRDSTEEKTTRSVQQTIANKYAIGEDAEGKYQADSKKAWTVGVTVTENEQSRTAFAHELEGKERSSALYNDCIKTTEVLDNLGLRGVTVKEHIPEMPKKNGTDNEAGTLKYNLYASTQTGKLTVKSELNKKTDVTTATITVNSNNVSTIEVNGEKGKWILVHMGVRGNTDTIIDENKNSKAVIVDPTDAGELLTKTKGSTSGAMLVPIWINLDSEEVKAITNANDKTLEVKFGSTGPVVEHNSFQLKVVDTNPVEEALELKEVQPEKFDSSCYECETGKEKETIDNMFPNDKNEGFYKEDTKAKALLENMKLLDKEAKITSYVEDDTVYTTIEADFDKFKDETVSTNFRIALRLNVAPLDVEKGADMSFYNDGTGKWIDTKADDDNEVYFTISLTGSNYTDIKTNKKSVTKEYIFANKKLADSQEHKSDIDHTSVAQAKNAKYVRYVITLVPTK